MIQILTGLCNGQVLQRNRSGAASATLRLKCPEKGTVRCTILEGGKALKSWKSRPVGEADGKGAASCELEGVPAGGPYQLEISCGRAAASVAQFYVGDVWLLAGQSNMEGCGDRDGAARPHPLIQAFTMNREWRQAKDPLHIPMESPDPCHSKGQPFTREQAEAHRRQTGKGVGAGIFFARKMLALSGVPQGLVCTAHGGTNMMQWDPAKKTTDDLYGSMLASVRATGQPVAGMLWYQGESDSNEEAQALYTGRMKKLVASTRKDLRQRELPWVVCQIARAYNRNDNSAHWNSIQEQQRLLPEVIALLDTVVTVDLPLDDQVHISSRGFPILAERLADSAARLVYKDSKRKPTPRLRDVRLLSDRNSHSLEVRYENIAGHLQSQGPAQGFSLADADGVSLPILYKTILEGDTARLHLGEYPPEGSTLSYGASKTPFCNITDGRGHALPVFAPQPIRSAEGWMPFVKAWNVSEILPSGTYSMEAGGTDELASRPTVVKTYGPGGFIDEHLAWEKKSGTCFFTCTMELPKSMRLEASMGYDGPFRMFIDGQPFFTDLAGTNPCFPDESRKPVQLGAGRHQIHVVMDLNNGLAWGFFLRFRSSSPRTGKTGAQPVFGL